MIKYEEELRKRCKSLKISDDMLMVAEDGQYRVYDKGALILVTSEMEYAIQFLEDNYA